MIGFYEPVSDVMKRIITNPWSYLEKISLRGVKYQTTGKDMDNSSMDMQPELIKQPITTLEHMDFPNHPHNCRSLDLSKHIRNFSPTMLHLWFLKVNDFSAEVLVEDRLSSLGRPNAFAKTGVPTENADNTHKQFVLEINQEVFDEHDSKIGCQKYPNERYATFKDCDRDYTRRFLAKVIFL